MPKLISFYVKHTLIGALVATAFMVILYDLDVAGIQRLVNSVDGGMTAFLVLWVMSVSLFSAVQFAVAVMLLPSGPDDDKGRRYPEQTELAPAPLTVQRKNTR